MRGMINTAICFGLLLAATTSRAELPAHLTAATDLWEDLVQDHVREDGGVDYQGLLMDRDRLEAFINAHDELDFAGLSDAEKTAVGINLYNAGMMLNIFRHADARGFGVEDPEFLDLRVDQIEVPGGNIWNGSYTVPLGGIQVTLDNIEHDLIRGEANSGVLAQWKVKTLDARIHAAVNCAALSCPPVRRQAYRAATLDAMLTENMLVWLNQPDQFRQASTSTLQANSIVWWYYSDFEEYGIRQGFAGAGSWLATYVDQEKADGPWQKDLLETEFNGKSLISLTFSRSFRFEYDWQINDIRNK